MDASSSLTTDPSPCNFKRPRTEGQDDAVPVVVRSSDPWLSDGTIILRTSQRVKGSTKPTQTLYKVHKTSNCTKAASEQYGGLPLMDMLDNTRDVENFLKAIYFPDYIHRHGRHTSGAPYWCDFPGMYMGTLRLAKKCNAPKVRQVIIDAIRKEWPTELRYWDKRQSLAAEDRASAIKAKLKSRVVFPEPAHTIRIAVGHGIPEVLPVAYYDLFRVYEFNWPGDCHHQAANIRVLTADEHYKLTLGMAAVRGYVHRVLRNLVSYDREKDMCSRLQFDPDSDSASEENGGFSPCTRPAIHWWRQEFELLVRSGVPLNSLKRTSEWVMGDKTLEKHKDSVCMNCRAYVKDIVEEKREDLWKKLPTLFNLRDRVGENRGS